METIRGKHCTELDISELQQRIAHHQMVALDLGTGDGRYVCQLAGQQPDWLVIGVDSCRENLRERSRTSLSNVLFIVASAHDLPRELHGAVSFLTINFPWGSLLEALLQPDGAVMAGLLSLSGPRASVGVRLNGGALAEAGQTLEAGTDAVRESLSRSGWRMRSPRVLDAAALRAFPSTWARRLACGRDPRAVLISGSLGMGAL